MAKRSKYVQCSMSRTVPGGALWTTSYIPQSFARLGRVFMLKEGVDHWVDGWVVRCVDSSAVDASDAPDYRKAIRRHRQATGDSQSRTH